MTGATQSGRVLEVEDLWVRFGRRDAVRGVSFHIDDGETVALVGESGSGKSATALSILQLLPYPLASHPRGSIRLVGQEMVGAPRAVLKRLRGVAASMIFQEPMTSLNPLHTVEKQIAEILKVHRGLDGARARARVLELLELVRVPSPSQRLKAFPHQLSGGQRQRVMIAMALANEPRLLIADEPTTALDVTIQKGILELLADLQRQLGMALLLISHDLGVVRAVAERVAVMQRGEIVEQGPKPAIFGAPQHPYTRHLLAAEPRGEAVAPRHRERLLAVRSLRVAYPRGKGWFGKPEEFVAVDDLSFELARGETLGVVGESGSGKTTLGLAVLRLLACRGVIEFDGVDLAGLGRRALRPLRRHMQMVFQDPFGSLSPRLSLLQIIEEGLRVHEPTLDAAGREARVCAALEEVGLEAGLRHRFPHEFSGGQRQRISLARALVLRPRLIVLDEPTSALDRSVQAQIVELLRDLQARHHLAYLFISHDMNVVRALATQLIVMRAGRVVEAGPAAAVFGNPREPYTRELMAAAFLPVEPHARGNGSEAEPDSMTIRSNRDASP
jgi:microcin C transport system ATP-binding protein